MARSAREQGLEPRTVKRFATVEHPEHLLGRALGRSSLLDDYKPYLLERIAEGCIQANTLHAELQARGWRGTIQTVRRFVLDITHTDLDVDDGLSRQPGYGGGAHVVDPASDGTERVADAASMSLEPVWPRRVVRLDHDDPFLGTTDQLNAADFQSLGKYEVYASLVANSESQPFCSATALPLPSAIADTEAVRARSRECRPRRRPSRLSGRKGRASRRRYRRELSLRHDASLVPSGIPRVR